MKSLALFLCLVLAQLINANKELPSPSKIQIEDRKLFRIVPNSEGEIDFLKSIRDSNDFELVFWNGIKGVGDPIEILATIDSILGLEGRLLAENDSIIEELYDDVKITMEHSIGKSADPEPIQNEPSSLLPTPSMPVYPPRPRNFSTIEKIPGTTLYTGVFYKLGMKKFPNGKVTWTDAKTEYNGHYVQIDLDPEHLTSYNPGEKWDADDQWMFEESEVPGWYTLTNRGVLDSVTTWSYQKVGSGYHVILSKKPEDVVKLSVGGEWRDDALWKPVRTKHSHLNYYQLNVRRYPRGIVTWTEKKYGSHSHYIQLATDDKHRHKYNEGNEWFEDSLFQFMPQNVKIRARVLDLEFNENMPKILESGKLSQVEYEYNLTNFGLTDSMSAQIDEIVLKNYTYSKYSFALNDSFKAFDEIKIDFNIENMDDANFEKVSPLNYVQSNVGGVYKVKDKVNIPPRTISEVSVHYDWVENIEVPFKAKVIVSAFSETLGILRGKRSVVERALGPQTIQNLYAFKAYFGDRKDFYSTEKNELVFNVMDSMNISCGIRAYSTSREIPLGGDNGN